MIDARDMAERHNRGLKDISSLEGQELLALQLYCQAYALSLLNNTERPEDNVLNITLNAVKTGIALGLGLCVTERELHGRP